MATQILGQMGRYPLGPFSVVMPGASMPETLDDLSRLLPAVAAHDVNGRPIGTHPSSIGRRTPPGSPREQLIAHLGLENLPELHDVVPSLDAADSKPTAPRGAFTAFAPEASA
jgi:hypothetical protein